MAVNLTALKFYKVLYLMYTNGLTKVCILF
jgi:hypothetical protein